MRNHLLVLVLVCLPCPAQVITLQPTTTLAAEAGNSSSVPDTFAGLSNGNSGAGNVSKVPTRSLLYPGNDTKIFAALMGWWGKSNHINVGYRSDDPVVVNRQVEDMISRGIDGAIIAWYGAGGLEDLTTKQLRTQAELHPGFKFAVMIDKGAIAWHSCAGCGPTDALIAHLNYLADNYYGSPAYFRINGQPVVVEFALESYAIDWNRVYASVRGNPFIVFRNVTGMSRPGKGAYAWGPSQSLSYNEWFYQQAPKYPEKQIIGGASKGFDDSLASWSQNRYVGQECGMTWLNTMAQVNKYYSSANQLSMLQLITWNDYEEGTAIEPGIDNCLTVTASVSGSVLSWQLNGAGSEATVDHYMVLLSTDDYNLAKVATLPAGTRSFDLRSLKLAPDSYTAYVKAVGKPSIRNQMSSAATYEVPNLPPVGSLSLSTVSGYTPLQVSASTAASTDSDGRVTSSVINFGNGQSAAGFNATATYTTAGTYTVQATVKDNLGAASTVRQSVTVKPAGDILLNISRTARSRRSSTQTASASASHRESLTVAASGYSGPVLLACGNVPTNLTCSLSQSTLNVNGTPQEVEVLIGVKGAGRLQPASAEPRASRLTPDRSSRIRKASVTVLATAATATKTLTIPVQYVQ